MKRIFYEENRGFTLIELLIALAIAGLVGMAALAVFTATNRSTTGQIDVTQAQQSVRASLDRISQHVRTAGFGLPDRTTFTLNFNGTNFTRAVTVTNSSTGSDTLTLVGIGHEIGQLATLGAGGCNQSGPGIRCLVLEGEIDTDMLAKAKYISLGGGKFYEVTGVDPASKRINLTEDLDGLPDEFFLEITPPASVFILQALRYSIVTDLQGCSVEVPCLAVQDFSGVLGNGNRQVMAQGIEDMQIAVLVTPQEGGAAVLVSDGLPISTLNNGELPLESPMITALRINLVGKAATPDRTTTSLRPALEDRAEGALDGYRRRVLTKVIKVRNPRPDS